MARKPRPPLSDWLITQRKARGESVEDTARIVDRSAATVRGWEAGRPPSSDDASIVVLERHYGIDAPRETSQAPDYAAVVAAIDRQTDMLKAVLDALAGPTLDPERQAWARRVRAATRPPVPTGDPARDTAR